MRIIAWIVVKVLRFSNWLDDVMYGVVSDYKEAVRKECQRVRHKRNS